MELLADATEYDPIVVIGEIAHMAAAQDQGPRANAALSGTTRNDYDNLILLCQNCHALIDGQTRTYSVELLKQLKAAHELWVRTSLPERGRSRTGWTALHLRGEQPVDLATLVEAVAPDFVTGEIHVVQVPTETDDWTSVDQTIGTRVAELLGGADQFDFRLFVLPLAPVSACIALGFHLTSRPHVQLLQYHRDDRTWAWPDQTAPDLDVSVAGLDGADPECKAVSFLFHFSAVIDERAIASVSSAMPRIDVRVGQPGSAWLQSPEQLKIVGTKAREALEGAMRRFPNAEQWHFFCAVPAPVAVTIGQQINPTMCPPVQLYEYRLRSKPPYTASIRLGAADKNDSTAVS